MNSNVLNQLQEVVQKALKLGATAADALMVEGQALSYAQRQGTPEKIERSESKDIGLRTFFGNRQAMVSSSDLSPQGLSQLVERAVEMAKFVPEDPYCGLAEAELVGTNHPLNTDSYDSFSPSLEHLMEQTKAGEEAALATPGITNSNGAEAAWNSGCISLVASNGFTGQRLGSSFSVSVAVIAGVDHGMEQDYDYSVAVFAEDLKDSTLIGKEAARRTLRRLNPRRVPTSQSPIVFDPRTGRSLLSYFASAINGQSIARGTSFLLDQLGKQVFSSSIQIIDDPLKVRGLASKPFDVEGLKGQKRAFVKDGILQSWVLDLRSARQLGLQSTAHASRGVSSSPHPAVTNFYLEAGADSPQQLIKNIKSGFYVTDTIGSGVNMVTGDYSVGASGFWIENGEIAYPVSEVTIAGNFKDMFRHLTAANDLKFLSSINTPTLVIEGMTIAGK